jgi:Tol biopolymer transport system component
METIEAGHATPPNAHRSFVQMYFMVSGRAHVYIGGEQREITAPAVAFVPRETEHHVENISDEPLQYVDAAADVELIVTDHSGRRLSSLETTGFPGSVRLSPDGLKVAVGELLTGGSEPGGLWIYDLSKRVRSKFTFGGLNSNPIWSPDGSQLAFSSDRTGTYNLYVKPATGGAEEQPLHATTDDERPQSWSPDGRYIVLDSRPQSRLGLPQIAILPMRGDRKPFPYLNSAHINSGGQVSPDGRWLAYESNETGPGDAPPVQSSVR